MSAWSGAVAEWPYTRITKSWPTFSSSVIREMRARSFRVGRCGPACAVPPTARTAVTPAVAARTVRLDGCAVFPVFPGASPCFPCRSRASAHLPS